MALKNAKFETGYAGHMENWDWLNANQPEMPAAFSATEIPAEVDPRPWHKIEMQGRMNSCAGHSLSSVVERLFWIAYQGKVTQFSRFFAYKETQKLDGIHGDNGSTIAGGLQLAMRTGLPPEEFCVYPKNYDYRSQYKDVSGNVLSLETLAEKASPFKAKSQLKVESYDHARLLLGTGWAIHLGCRWPIEIDGTATIRNWNYGYGLHATAGLGYLSDDRLVWANSHDSVYGDHGWYYWTPKAFDSMLKHGDTVCRALNDMENPEPRQVNYFDLV